MRAPGGEGCSSAGGAVAHNRPVHGLTRVQGALLPAGSHPRPCPALSPPRLRLGCRGWPAQGHAPLHRGTAAQPAPGPAVRSGSSGRDGTVCCFARSVAYGQSLSQNKRARPSMLACHCRCLQCKPGEWPAKSGQRRDAASPCQPLQPTISVSASFFGLLHSATSPLPTSCSRAGTKSSSAHGMTSGARQPSGQ